MAQTPEAQAPSSPDLPNHRATTVENDESYAHLQETAEFTDKKNRNSLKVLIAGVALSLAAGGAGGAYTLKSMGNSLAEDLTLPPAATAEQFPGQSPDVTYEARYAADPRLTQDNFDRVDKQAPLLDEWRADSLGFMQDLMHSRQKDLFNNPLPEDKSKYSDQDVLNQYSIDIYDATAQPNTPEGDNAGEALLDALIANPSTSDAYRVVYPYINSPYAVVSTFEATSQHNTMNQGDTFMSIEIAGSKAKFIESSTIKLDGLADEKNHGLFELIETENGNNLWVLTQTFPYSENLAYEINRLDASN